MDIFVWHTTGLDIVSRRVMQDNVRCYGGTTYNDNQAVTRRSRLGLTEVPEKQLSSQLEVIQ
jgi:hypothetical protein